MNLAVNAISAKRGGALTYLTNVLPELRRQLPIASDPQIVVWRGAFASSSADLWPEGVDYRHDSRATGGEGAIGGSLRRLWFDQVVLPGLLRAEQRDALFSTANFGTLSCPCRQVLLVRNAAYFDDTFMRRMTEPRLKTYHLFQRWLTLRSLAAADIVLFPSRAMLDLVAKHAGGARPNWHVASYGTRHDLFQISAAEPATLHDPVRLLHVSYYCDQKNLGTLLRALALLHQRHPQRYHLRLNAGFDRSWMGSSAFFPRFLEEQTLYRHLQADGVAEDSDWQTYSALPAVYRDSDIFVFPSYIESFGHPLIEAMACGLPVVAADTSVNRELCGEAATYFSPFDIQACAAAIEAVSTDVALCERLRTAARERAPLFTWERHVSVLLKALKGELN